MLANLCELVSSFLNIFFTPILSLIGALYIFQQGQIKVYKVDVEVIFRLSDIVGDECHSFTDIQI